MFCCRESDRAPVDRLPMDNEVDETFMDLALEVSKKSPVWYEFYFPTLHLV